jgi:hypothetical protein
MTDEVFLKRWSHRKRAAEIPVESHGLESASRLTRSEGVESAAAEAASAEEIDLSAFFRIELEPGSRRACSRG